MMYSHLSNFLRRNEALQCILGVVTLVFAMSYIALFTYDLGCAYSIIDKNNKSLKLDLYSDYIVSYELDLDGNGTLTNDVNETYDVSGVTFAYATNIQEGYCRYNHEENVLVIKLDDSFGYNFLMSESYFVVLVVMIFLIVLFTVAHNSGKFEVLSNKSLLYTSWILSAILAIDGVFAMILL